MKKDRIHIYEMIQAQVMRMIRQKDIRDDNGEKLNTLKIAVTKLKKENIKLTLQNEELLKEIERLKLQLEKK